MATIDELVTAVSQTISEISSQDQCQDLQSTIGLTRAALAAHDRGLQIPGSELGNQTTSASQYIQHDISFRENPVYALFSCSELENVEEYDEKEWYPDLPPKHDVLLARVETIKIESHIRWEYYGPSTTPLPETNLNSLRVQERVQKWRRYIHPYGDLAQARYAEPARGILKRAQSHPPDGPSPLALMNYQYRESYLPRARSVIFNLPAAHNLRAEGVIPQPGAITRADQEISEYFRYHDHQDHDYDDNSDYGDDDRYEERHDRRHEGDDSYDESRDRHDEGHDRHQGEDTVQGQQVLHREQGRNKESGEAREREPSMASIASRLRSTSASSEG